MAVALKNNAETASGSIFDRLPVAVLAGMVYVLGSLAIVFKAIPTLVAVLAPGESYVNVTVQVIAMMVAAAALFIGGLRLMGPHPPRGLRSGIFFGLVAVLVVGFLASWIGGWLEARFFEDNWLGGSWSYGVVLTTVIAVALVYLAGWAFLRSGFQSFLGSVEEQGWFNAFSYKRNQGLRVRRGTIVGILLLVGSGVYMMIERASVTEDTTWAISLPYTGEVKVTRDSLGDVNQVRTLNEDGQRVTTEVVLDQLRKKGKREENKDAPGTADWSVAVDRFELRDFNQGFTRDYEKVNARLNSVFQIGDVVKPGDLNKSFDNVGATRPENDKVTISSDEDGKPKETDIVKKPSEISGKPEYKTVPLLPHTKFTLPLVIIAVALWLAWRIVNVPSFADFLIATEAEMNKVSWTTRKRLVQDTIVVLITVILSAAFLLAADALWSGGLRMIGVLHEAKTTTETEVPEPPW